MLFSDKGQEGSYPRLYSRADRHWRNIFFFRENGVVFVHLGIIVKNISQIFYMKFFAKKSHLKITKMYENRLTINIKNSRWKIEKPCFATLIPNSREHYTIFHEIFRPWWSTLSHSLFVCDSFQPIHFHSASLFAHPAPTNFSFLMGNRMIGY